MSNIFRYLGCLSALILVFAVEPAYAYLDPGTGALLLQLLLGGIAGAAVLGKLFWAKIKLFFGFRAPPPDDQPQVAEPQQEQHKENIRSHDGDGR